MTSISDDKKISFIICTNDDGYADECERYIKNLYVPTGYEIDVFMITQAGSMAGGYNEGMGATDAKYKIYLHQDVMIYKKDFIKNILKIFKSDDTVGMIGLVGNTVLPESAMHWDEGAVRVGGIYIDSLKEGFCKLFGKTEGDYGDVIVIDGLLMATQYDIRWREDLFTGWHFYDLSQSMEFRRAGYRVVPHMEEPWCFHDNDIHILGDEYHRYREIFLREYGDDLK